MSVFYSQSTADAGIAIEAGAPTTELSKKRATDSRSDVQALKDKPVAAGGNAGVGTSMLRENVTASQIAGALPASAPSAATSNVPAPSAPLFGPSRVSGVVIADADAAEQAPPRVVGTPRVFGEKRTLYEVAPGDTVLLAEVLQTRLEAVAVTGMGESRQTSERSTPRPASKAATAAVAPDTQPRPVQPMSASAVSPKGRTLSAEISNGVTTITWIDPATGTTMKLSGKHSREELEGIRRRIEQARAAAAAAAQKKSP